MGKTNRERRAGWISDPAPALRAAVLVPLGILAGSVVILTVICRHLLHLAATGSAQVDTWLPLTVAAGGFLLASGAVVLLQATRVANRVAGPEYRLSQAMRRIRAGDLSFRVHLRRGDMLSGLADELNDLLDWLNENPPAGAKTGSDLVDMEHDAEVLGEHCAVGPSASGRDSILDGDDA